MRGHSMMYGRAVRALVGAFAITAIPGCGAKLGESKVSADRLRRPAQRRESQGP